MANKLYFFSHSRAEADSYCKRKRFLGSEWGGTGLEPTLGGWDLKFGNIIHSALDALAGSGAVNFDAVRTQTYETALTYLNPDQAKDYATLAEGMLRGFAKNVWPLWMKDYDVVETENLRRWEVEPDHIFRFKQDILLKAKETANLVYVDYKTTSSDSPQWMASWTKSPQLHSSMYALRQGYGIEVNHAFVQGLYKGYKDRKNNRLSSIFCRGWVNREYPMSPQYSYTYQRSKGWEPFFTFDEFDDLSGWIGNMPPEILAEQFPRTGPIYPRADVGEIYFRQQMFREREVRAALELMEAEQEDQGDDFIRNMMDSMFPQDFHKCTPPYGFSCEFESICWTPWIANDPLGSGQFIQRTPQQEDLRVEEEEV